MAHPIIEDSAYSATVLTHVHTQTHTAPHLLRNLSLDNVHFKPIMHILGLVYKLMSKRNEIQSLFMFLSQYP